MLNHHPEYPPVPRWPRLCLLALSLLPVGCKKALPDRMEIPESRPVFSKEGAIKPSTALERNGSDGQMYFNWTAPESWKLKPSTDMRQVNFGFGPANEGECYLSLTNGGAGATVAEFTRWKKQMGQPPMEAAGVAGLDKITFLTTPCPYIKLDGSYTPASGMAMAGLPVEAKPDYGMLGIVFEIPFKQAVITLKMVGPKALVEQETEHFKSFASSFNIKSAPAAPTTEPAPAATDTP